MAGIFDAAALSKRKIEEAEKELDAALEKERPDELGAKAAETEKKTSADTSAEVKSEDVPEVVDGVNWKQRYGNLQRYIDKNLKPKFEEEVKGLKATVEQLQSQVEKFKQTAAPAELPVSKEEVEALKKENPAAYAAILAIAQDVANGIVAERVKGFEGTVKEINARQKQTAEQEAWLALQRRHSDIDLAALNEDPAFHEWLDGKPKMFQSALRENKTDIDAADEVIRLYRMENNIGKKKASSKGTPDEGARSVKLGSSKPDISDTAGGWVFTETQIQAMSSKQYEANLAKIEEAHKAGRILPDLTDPNAAARMVMSAKAA